MLGRLRNSGSSFVTYVVLGAFTLDTLNMLNDVYPNRLLITAQNLIFEAVLARNM